MGTTYTDYLKSSKVTASVIASDIVLDKTLEYHLLVSSNIITELSEALISALEDVKYASFDFRTIIDGELCPTRQIISPKTLVLQNGFSRYIKNTDITLNSYTNTSPNISHRQAYDLCEWADLLVLAPIDADTLAKMQYGICDSLLLMVLRGWNVKKKILMIPGMMKFMWENPMTKDHLRSIKTKCPWVQVLPPILWTYEEEDSENRALNYNGLADLIKIVKDQVEKVTRCYDVQKFDNVFSSVALTHTKPKTKLPPELWTLILEYLGDWEISQALNVYTTIPIPNEWQKKARKAGKNLDIYLRSLENIILTARTHKIIDKLKEAPENLTALSSLCIKLLLKFCLVDVLTYLETNLEHIFWASFGEDFLPTVASAFFGQPKILDWWLKSSSFTTKNYTAQAIDGASKMGFVHILEWWRCSGLPLKYTEVALEQASSRGHIAVLDWWKKASTARPPYQLKPGMCHSNEINCDEATFLSKNQSSLPLLPGKSLLTAAQNNQVQVLRWWDISGLPVGNSESVARVASQYGHVEVLQTWLELKGEKMSFDCQILIDPTKNGHLDVLQWWKNFSLGAHGQPSRTVQYKTCDIEEALEDSIRNEKIVQKVRDWWAQNGLNLGLQVRDWTRIRVL